MSQRTILNGVANQTQNVRLMAVSVKNNNVNAHPVIFSTMI